MVAEFRVFFLDLFHDLHISLLLLQHPHKVPSDLGHFLDPAVRLCKDNSPDSLIHIWERAIFHQVESAQHLIEVEFDDVNRRDEVLVVDECLGLR